MANDKDWIQTFTGKRFAPLDPDPKQIVIEDIAHALSMICRYTGHVAKFYSVAEHCVRVSYRSAHLAKRTGDWYQSPDEVACWGLLHDASEAYIADVSRPVKYQLALGGYREVEKKLQAAIIERFGLPTTEPPEVKQADNELLGVEAPRLFKTGLHPDWCKTTSTGTLEGSDLTMADVSDKRWVGWKKHLGWTPERAERLFMRRFHALFGNQT